MILPFFSSIKNIPRVCAPFSLDTIPYPRFLHSKDSLPASRLSRFCFGWQRKVKERYMKGYGNLTACGTTRSLYRTEGVCQCPVPSTILLFVIFDFLSPSSTFNLCVRGEKWYVVHHMRMKTCHATVDESCLNREVISCALGRNHV